MQHQESYWSRKAPPTPELRDLSAGTCSGDERSWGSLSPGMRRTIWRDALVREAKSRGLPDETVFRLKIATIDGWLPTLDECLDAFQMQDERRAPLPEDVERLKRADDTHRQAEAQILAREAL